LKINSIIFRQLSKGDRLLLRHLSNGVRMMLIVVAAILAASRTLGARLVVLQKQQQVVG